MKFHQLLLDHYGLVPETVTRLEGYDSINYKIETAKGTYVLKQYDNTSVNKELLRSENRILSLLSTLNDYQFPVPITGRDQSGLVENKDALYRLLTYVKGDFLGDVEPSPRLHRSFGIFLAKMDSVLLSSYVPAMAAKEIQWDLKHFESNYKFIQYIPHPKDRSLADYFFLQFEEQVSPLRHQLRKSIIHNDGNDWNVLTKNGKVSGIIDFGDMCHSWLINELAVALSYVMMEKEDPIKVAKTVIRAYHGILPLELSELDVLYYLIAARLCISVCNSAYTKTLKPESAYVTISEKQAWALLRKWIQFSPIKARDEFRTAAGFPKGNKPLLQSQLQRRSELLSNSLSLSYDHPIQMHQSAFQYMYDTDGNTFLDAYNNIMLAGHCHPSVVRAGQRAMARLNTNTRYIYEALLTYGDKLLAKFPSSLSKVFFVNSGSAATDLAIRLVTKHTGRKMIMALEHGYHGNTRMGIAISHYKYSHGKGIGKPPSTLVTPMPKAFDSGYPDDGTAGTFFANAATRTIDNHFNDIAAFIAEPVVGCGGQVPLAAGYLKQVYPKIRDQGGVCISDEVQVGFGRLGDYFWGYEMHEVIPDMVIIGKPMGNGHPIGAVITTDEIAGSFEEGPEFFSSFGGNPVSCAIGEAVLDVIEEEGLQAHARVVGNHLVELLKKLQQQFPVIADVRGSGLFLGVELVDGAGRPDTVLAAHVKNSLRQQHILVGTDGPFNSVLKIKPPLSFTKDDAGILAEALAIILKKY